VTAAPDAGNAGPGDVLTPFERRILDHFLAGPSAALSVLREQAASLRCASREETAAGLTVRFAVAADAPRLDRRLDTHLDDVLGEVAALDSPMMFMLWIDAGRLSMLEGTVPGHEWPVAPVDVRIFYENGDRDLSRIEQALTFFPITT
jgi:hypothetical protein